MVHRIAVVLLLALAAACNEQREPTLSVWAAASLTDVLPRVGRAFAAEEDVEIRFSFDASSRLARQIEAGAPADLFVSADQRWMDHLERGAHVDPSTETRLLGNELVLVVPADAITTPGSPSDLRH